LTVRAIIPGGASPFEQVRDQLLAELRQEKAVDLVIEASNTLDESLARGTPMAEAAAAAGASVTVVQSVDNTGAAKITATTPDLPASQDVVKLAFTTPAGETSPTTEGSDGGYFAVHVEAVEPALLRPLADVRAQVAADWAAEQQATAAKAAAEALANRLREGGDPAAVAATVAGAVVGRTPELHRTPIQGQDAPLPAPVLTDLFAQPANGVVVGEAESGWVVARLVQVIPADPVASAPFVSQIRTAVTSAVAGDLLAQLLAGLESRYPVEVNSAAISRMYGTEP
jgi:peptidyl-prolyl cis-trans isomerase D